MPNAVYALPVISSIGEHQKYLGPNTGVSQNCIDARRNYQTDAIAQSIGVPTAELMNSLDYVFAKYEIPMGLLDKLMIISKMDCLEFLCDESGSMSNTSDQKDSNGRPMTRWMEMRERIKIMIEVLAYIPFKCIEVRFLNRSDVMQIVHAPGEPPQHFIARVYRDIDAMWERGPSGSTPALRAIQQMLNRRQGQFVARYVFSDGVPDGGETEIQQITDLLIRRRDPARNPFTFMSCSENDDDVAWMKLAEELAPYAGEYDDYVSEHKEVCDSQGALFPFSHGIYIVGMLVGALNPTDLDNLDEAIPFSKATMNDLLGYCISDSEYDAYFNGFLTAQLKKPIESSVDRIRVNYARNIWPKHREEFRAAKINSQVPAVQQYQKDLADHSKKSSSGCDCVVQ